MTMPFHYVSGAKIVELRRAKEWDQQTLAQKADIPASVLSRLERDLQEDCTISVLSKIAGTLGVTVDSLLRQPPNTYEDFSKLEPEFTMAILEVREQPYGVQRQAAHLL